MRKSVFIATALLAVIAQQASFADKQPSGKLVNAVGAIKKLDPDDFTALKNWMNGQGRASLRQRGLSDQDIGGVRLDTDRFGDAPLVP